MSGRPSTDRNTHRLIACSSARTLLQRDLPDGRTVLVKLFDSGNPAEAEREMEVGRLLAGRGIARHLEATVDPVFGRPSLVQEFVPGLDLAHVIDQRGPLDAVTATHVTHNVAAVLARFQEHTSGLAPNGLVHCDVKPSNILLSGDLTHPEKCQIHLLDLEHATAAPPPGPVSTPSTGQFSGGTHGFSPPEAYDGSAPTEAFDVFGFGVTLFHLLTGRVAFGAANVDTIEAAIRAGRWRRRELIGCPTDLAELVESCLSPRAADRPPFAAIRELLEQRLENPPDKPARKLEKARMAMLAGRFEAAREHIAGTESPLEAAITRRERLKQRVGELPAIDERDPIEELAHSLGSSASTLLAHARITPSDPEVLERRAAFRRATARALHDLPARIAECCKNTLFDDASALLESLEVAFVFASRHARIPPNEPEQIPPTPAERDPGRYIASTRDRIHQERADHDALLGQLHEAERQANLAAAAAAIESLTERHGGASGIVAQLKDRLHRFEFYLARLSGLIDLIDQLQQMCATEDIDASFDDLLKLRAWCSRGIATPAREEGSNVRALLRALRDMTNDYPVCAEHIDPAVRCLRSVLVAMTEHAWRLVGDATEMLAVPPIPIRPLQTLVGRLDNLILLDALVDLDAERPRTTLSDEIERVRSDLEKARSARDRIAQGAQEAMDRGHLTTALFEVERAVDRFGQETEEEGPGLAEQFEELKRKKREVEEALEANHRLAREYAERAADGSSTAADRLHTLEEREQVLSFLCANLGPERAPPYARDLRGVQLDIVRETAADGETRLRMTRAAHDQRRLSIETFERLQQSMPEGGAGEPSVEEARAVIRSWQERVESFASHGPDPAPGRRTPTPWRAFVAVFGIVAILIVLVATQLGDSDEDPIRDLEAALGSPTSLTQSAAVDIEFDRLQAFQRSLRSLTAYRELGEQVTNVVDAISDIRRGAGTYDRVDLAIDQLARAGELLEGQHASMKDAIQSFSTRARRTGFAAATGNGNNGLSYRLENDADLRRTLSAEDADVLRQWLTN